ncbi:cytochrome c [Mesorhizobium sp. MSK_1335]|uniref:Cytochrome c n=1 Tax=Mesorhizobium montanum TaxID=3072323 RepID=A0ABU4ZU56_9HYPH|nr:cytochrome c [Mesorhizobium sp. MSK_1335]MDX8528945.1 cytochrome c [Mesorhizobium sp. MSK_1335]
MTRSALLALISSAALTGAGMLVFGPFAHGQIGDFAKQEHGRQLVAAGDCVACHTAEDGNPFAGNRPIETPFGTIYSANITPDAETGIGAWTEAQFYRAMHDGIASDGRKLYPAFPYPWFTKATREDVDDIRAYLRTLEPVRSVQRPNEFPWPLNHRVAMEGWNSLFFTPGEFKPDMNKSAEWNRGAYLVEGLAHCGACHTPKDVFGAAKTSQSYQGSEIQNWFAPNLTGDSRTGLGGWSEQDIVAFLKTGRNDRTTAYGPMAAVVKDSTSKMTDGDLKAIAIYLKSLAASPAEAPSAPAANVMSAGKNIYTDQCSACHQLGGDGVKNMFPSLKGSAAVQSHQPFSVVRLVLNGGHAASGPGNPNMLSMPSFGWKLSDREIAAVTTYIRNAWGNKADPVAPDDVKALRDSVEAKTSAY